MVSRIKLLAAIVLWLSLPVAGANAGLQSAIETIFDQLEASNPVRGFVSPVAGNDWLCVGAACPEAPALSSAEVKLVYDWNTGNVSVQIPAALLDVGAQPGSNYAKIYTIADLVLDLRLVPDEKTTLSSTIFGWQQFAGPLETIDLNPSVLRSDEQFFWEPNGLILPGSWSSPPLRPAAAVVDFGRTLAPGLTQSDFAALGFGDPLMNYVDYFNHRGISSLRVPLTLVIAPEPGTAAELLIGVTLASLVATGRRRTEPPNFA